MKILVYKWQKSNSTKLKGVDKKTLFFFNFLKMFFFETPIGTKPLGCFFFNKKSYCFNFFTAIIKGVDKKNNLAAYFPQSVAVSGERSSEKNNLSKIEKTGGRQRAFGPLALAPCFFNFWKIVFLGTPIGSKPPGWFFFQHPLFSELCSLSAFS